MLRINLLPKEVVERRRYEGWYRWVFILAVGLILIVFAVYLLLYLEAGSKAGVLQQVQEKGTQTKQLADTLAVFETKEQDLAKRQQTAQTALAGRINVGQLANEVSLVLPDEVWLDTLTISQGSGITLGANTPRDASTSTDVAYKSVAKTLVRLNELPDVVDVWLTTAVNATWAKWTPAVEGASTPDPVNVVTFQAIGKVVAPAAPATATPVQSSTPPAAVPAAGAGGTSQ